VGLSGDDTNSGPQIGVIPKDSRFFRQALNRKKRLCLFLIILFGMSDLHTDKSDSYTYLIYWIGLF
jgi:hypothetical protein